jgi:CysZ protein
MGASPDLQPATAPGLLRRAAAGAWHVPAAFAFLFQHPRLLPLAALPALLAGACVTGGLIVGVYAGSRVEAVFGPAPGRYPDVIAGFLAATTWMATLTACLALGLAAALLLAAPALDLLSRHAEMAERGQSVELSRGLRWEVAQSLRSALYFLAAAPLVFLIGLVPFVGPPLAALWAARALSFQLTEPTLVRRGLGFRERREWHRRWRPESMGYGLVALLVLLVPCANFVLVPALVVGGTRLVLELPEAA